MSIYSGLATLMALVAPLSPPRPAVSPPPAANSADVQGLFKSLAGEWSCAGAFANGKPLSADLSFSPILGGQALHYHHADRAPTSYVQDSVWSIDKDSGRLVSLAWTASTAQPGTSAALYVADSVSASGATFVHKALLKEPWAPNRFRYSVSGDALHMVWEVEKQGAWQMGDHIDCTRAR